MKEEWVVENSYSVDSCAVRSHVCKVMQYMSLSTFLIKQEIYEDDNDYTAPEYFPIKVRKTV